MSVLTDFGKEIRKLRIERGETMQDMGGRVNKSPSFLSAIENGRKPVPHQLVDDIAKAYSLADNEATKLHSLAAKNGTQFRISPKREEDQALVATFARRLDSLNEQQKEKILRILLKD